MDTPATRKGLHPAAFQERFAMIQSAKLLVVGAGGIGCELLKNLVPRQGNSSWALGVVGLVISLVVLGNHGVLEGPQSLVGQLR